MSLVLWVVVYLTLIFSADHWLSPEGFFEWFAVVLISWVFAEMAQKAFE